MENALRVLLIAKIPNGSFAFVDYMDDDGQGNTDLPIHVLITIKDESVVVDFGNTSPQVAGNINCPMSVTAAAVFYVFRCLMPNETPACAGSFIPIKLNAPVGSLLNSQNVQLQ